jgi:hypothetical protein
MMYDNGRGRWSKPTALFYSSLGIFNFNWYCISSPPHIPRPPEVGLESGGLMWMAVSAAIILYNKNTVSIILLCWELIADINSWYRYCVKYWYDTMQYAVQ